MTNIIRKSSLILFFILSILSATNLTTLYCQVNQANIRAEPDINSTILGTLSLNDSIVPIAENNNWYKIDYQRQEAWVNKAFFSENKSYTMNSNPWVSNSMTSTFFVMRMVIHTMTLKPDSKEH